MSTCALTAVKVFALAACLIGSLYSLKHVDVRDLKRGFKGLSFKGLLGKDSGFVGKPSQCKACLAAGKDFCISGNTCIPRATFGCRGPYDHITGDEEFALHGNPDGIQHSMVCPEEKEVRIDKQDCFFDEECHAKVNWEKIGKIKGGFFARLKYFKEKNDADGVKKMMSKVHEMFREAGMPDDRIDYILVKWAKSVYPEAMVDTKDCYFDPECHAKVDWEKIGRVKGRFFMGLKKFKENNNADRVKQMMSRVHAVFLEAGMPDDRIDYILTKWVKSVYPEALADTKDCYFDPECHAKVDWEKIGKIKKGVFARLKYFKEKNDADGVKRMMSRVHEMFREAGMPDDRIDYILTKWEKSVKPEAKVEKSVKPEAKVDTKDCYFDPECHAKVDWDKIGKIKQDFFARLKVYKEKNDEDAVKEMMSKVHDMFREAGMPDDRIDYILTKWSKVDTKDCYFDPECHAKVDWEKIGNIKQGFFGRLKHFKEKSNADGVKNMMSKVHEIFRKAGMPDDRIDYILVKWVKSVYPEAVSDHLV